MRIVDRVVVVPEATGPDRVRDIARFELHPNTGAHFGHCVQASSSPRVRDARQRPDLHVVQYLGHGDLDATAPERIVVVGDTPPVLAEEFVFASGKEVLDGGLGHHEPPSALRKSSMRSLWFE